MIGRLEGDGLVDRAADKSLTFTEKGHEHAANIVRRHRLIERFLTDVFDIPWDQVHEEAERLEHWMSPVVEERMLNAIGDAKTCPHGHPIYEGARIEGVPLADVEVGAKLTVLRFENEAEDLLHYLMDTGLKPGHGGRAGLLGRRRGGGRGRRPAAVGEPQRGRDGLGHRRPLTAAAGGAAGSAGLRAGALRPLAPQNGSAWRARRSKNSSVAITATIGAVIASPRI